MEDSKIISLYFRRLPEAIEETDAKYGSYCQSISYNILGIREDAEECVNDTYLTVWNRIPPTRPTHLSIFLGRITRNLSIDRWRRSQAAKRGKGQLPLAISELDYCLASGESLEDIYYAGELRDTINAFLRTLQDTERRVFICRYWYLDPVSQISREFGFSQSKVKSMLMRTRNKLKEYLLEKGDYEV